MPKFRIFISFVLLTFICVTLHSKRNTPLMGWSSWNTYRVNINDSLIRKQADAMVSSGLKDYGYEYINVDDGFFGFRDSVGKMHAHPLRFPRGMKSIADHIHSLGLKAGLYSDAGSVTCGSIWDKDPEGIGAGLYGHEFQDAELYFSDWGFDFIKIDYCGAGQELDLDEKERYSFIKSAIDSCGRDDIDINICRWAFPGTWASDIASSWRISGDITDSWPSIRKIIEKNLPLSAYCRDSHFNDMDMLEIGRSLSESEERVHFGLWCIMSSPLLIGCDLTSIPAKSLELLKNTELIAINQDSLALQAYPVQKSDGAWVLVKDIIEKRSNKRVVALYNSTDTLRRIAVALKDLELDGLMVIHDLFNHRDSVVDSDSLIRTVPPRDVLIYKVEAQRRVDPVIYEAEWAYLPMFNDLGKRRKEIRYAENNEASAGFVVANGGGQFGNSIIWQDVFSSDGGDYNLSVFYFPVENRGLEVIVNGISTDISRSLETKGNETIITLPVKLNKGYNHVMLTCRTMWMPDIDKIQLVRR